MIVSRARFVQDRTPNIVSFQGTYINGNYISLFNLIDENINQSDLEAAINRDLNYIQYILACDTIRIVMRPFDPTEDNNGFQYPIPSSLEKQNLRTIINCIINRGFSFFPVFVLPEQPEYMLKDPDSIDNFYAYNNQKLIDNQITFTNEIMNVIQSDYKWVDYYGDYDPLDVYNRGLQYQNKWFDLLKQQFQQNNWFPEVIGSVNDPANKIPQELQYLKDHGVDTRLSFQLYTDNTNYNFDFNQILQNAYNVAGEKMLIEEAGSNTSDFTDDGDYGRIYFRKVFEARNNVCPNIPVGLWCWGGQTTPEEWNWSLNRNIWDMRPCWWYIQEGASGLMWNIDSTPIVYAARKQSNFVVFKNIPRNSTITIRRTASWSNHVKDGPVYFGQWDHPIGNDIGNHNQWWPNGQSNVQYNVPDIDDPELWISVDFNWIDPNLYATVELV